MLGLVRIAGGNSRARLASKEGALAMASTSPVWGSTRITDPELAGISATARASSSAATACR